MLGFKLANKAIFRYTRGMNKTLFLTDAERALFSALPSFVQEGWDVQTESLDAYESVRQMKIRYSLADFSFHPDMKVFAETIANGGEPDMNILDTLNPEVEKEIFFVLGARGVKSLMETLLAEISNDEDVELLASLSVIRHELLSINASATHN